MLMTYTRDQLINALQNEYEYLIHDDFDPDTDMSASEHLDYLNSLNVEQLIDAADCDAEYTLDMFMRNHGWCLPWGGFIPFNVDFHSLLVHLTNSHMISIPTRTSDAVDAMSVSLRRGIVRATFSSGTYEYTGISRRAILNLILNPNMSLGFWINENVLATKYNDYSRLPVSVTA